MYPIFDIGVEYIELKGGIYRFKLIEPITIEVPQLWKYKHKLSLRDGNDKEWARINHDLITVSDEYAWNGASPKWWVPLIGWVGTPDPISTRMATLFHDVMYQFITTKDFPLTVEDANQIFFDIMKAHEFKLANTYFGAVKDFGKRFAEEPPTNGEHSVLLA